MAENDIKSWVDTTVGGHYLVERKLGEGGMGEVYLARDLRLDGKVVLKAPRPGMLLEDPDLQKRFLHEVRAIAQLDHPHVVKVHNIFQYEDRPVAVMQYLEGGTLDDRTDIPLSRWLPQIAEALDYIHGKELVHRDVKPANILFDSHANAYLSDFGVVKSTVAQTMMTMTGVSMGTPKYMSPEVIQAAPFDGRADQYALAIIVYEQLSGRMPFEATTPMHMFAAHLSQTPLPLCECDAHFSRRLSDVLSCGMAKEPSARFGSCAELASAVLEVLNDETASSADPAIPPRPAGSSLAETNRVAATPYSSTFDPRPLTARPPSLPTSVSGQAKKTSANAAMENGFEERAPSSVLGSDMLELFTRVWSRWREKARRIPPILAIGGVIGLLLLVMVIITTIYWAGPGETGSSSALSSTVTYTTGGDSSGPWTTVPADRPFKPTPALDKNDNAPLPDGPIPVPAEEVPPPSSGPTGDTFTNSIGMKFKRIPAGEFIMGSPSWEVDHDDNRELQHRVRITKPFYLSIYEVTVGDFRKFVEATGYKTEAEKDDKGGNGWNENEEDLDGPDPKYTWRYTGWPRTDSHPVVNVTWNDAVVFCEWLSWSEDGHDYRLPTEAEWEYACRAETKTKYYNGDDPEALVKIGNVADDIAGEKFNWRKGISAQDGYAFTAPVGSFPPNKFGLYDMHGNVCEWCMDWGSNYTDSPEDDPTGPSSGSLRMYRGGSWDFAPEDCRSAARHAQPPEFRYRDIGFRPVLVPAE